MEIVRLKPWSVLAGQMLFKVKFMEKPGNQVWMARPLRSFFSWCSSLVVLVPTCNLGPNEDGGKGTGEDTSGKIDIPRKWQVLRGKGTGEQWEVSEIWQFFFDVGILPWGIQKNTFSVQILAFFVGSVKGWGFTDNTFS